MSEWDFNETDASDDFSTQRQGNKRKNDYVGGLNTGMTVCCFLAVVAVSFLVAWLMKDTARSFWFMGLTFAAPFAALMISALLVENATGRMTPQCSRNAQRICVLVTVVAAFVIGCLSEILHQPVIVERVEPEYDYLIVVDKSGSMVYGGLEEPSKKALHELIEYMEDGNNVGIVAFASEVAGEQDIAPLDDEQRARIGTVIDFENNVTSTYDAATDTMHYVGGGTNFSDAMSSAVKLIERMLDRNRTMRIILVTDGDDASVGNFEEFNEWASKQNNGNAGVKQVELCAFQLGEVPMLDMVKEAVNLTGGTIYDKVQVDELAPQLQTMKKTIVIPEPVDTLKATYAGQTADGKPNTPYMILTCVLLILQGLLCGIALKIMFSVEGQFRFQTILSPLMGLAAFLLLNFGRYIGIEPAWLCEAIAFSCFGLVFMRENLNTGSNIARKNTSGKKKKASAAMTEVVDEDF